MAKKIKTTTRSYTLGLLAPSDTSDWLPLWSRLFATHHAICKGAKEFGDFYLNLRGGLSATLADRFDEENQLKRRQLQRGARRMLALGWLSVEDELGAQKHPNKVRETKSGESLSRELAESLLRDILMTHKGVSQVAEVTAWVDDCILALTANIRTDAVIVNRAAAFAEWQKSVGSDGAEMPEHARRILFTMCGSGFVSLTLPDETSVKAEEIVSEAGDENDPDATTEAKSKAEDEDAVEPSNASRGIFGDLFGGDATGKMSRAAGKDEFAASIRKRLVELGDVPPTHEIIVAFRAAKNLPELDISDPEKYPPEVSSSGAPTAVAKRYRKLLVCLGLWPKSADEDGIPRTQAVASYGKRFATQNKNEGQAQINAWDLVDACPKLLEGGEAAAKVAASSERVFTPSWANDLAKRVAAATNMPTEAKSLNEFKRLMFALAARRISQTQSWTKLNEIERHKAAVKEDSARDRLRELDADGRARTWMIDYEQKRAEFSSALSGFQITKRMIGECDSVFSSWQKSNSAEEREEQTALVQSEAEKFGDPAFYTDLSADPNAEVIWRHSQGADILKEWVKFRNAQCDQQRRKIPRFCHPDSFRHPTWCEFGGSSKPKVWYAWNEAVRPQKPEPGGNADGSRQLWLLLPDFESKQAKAVPTRWRNKRLSKDLGEASNIQEHPIPRADRLGLAAAKLPVQDEKGNLIRYRPQFPFSSEAKGWNARLQISRDSLLKLEHQWDPGRGIWKDSGKALRSARWFVTFAPALAISDGPGRQIHAKLGWRSSPHSEQNKKQKRGLHAQLILSRLPGLRVLSVDLGHRFAAACVVWETLSAPAMAQACREHGPREPQESDLFIHLTRTVKKERKKGRDKGKTMPVAETTIYRRIGEDFLRDPKTGEVSNTPHPAPWAKLDRQFLIKLQGEERPAREASNEELWLVHQIERDLGLATPLIDRLVQSGWGLKGDEAKGERQPARIAALRTFGWVPQAASQLVLDGVPSISNRRPSLHVDELMSDTIRTFSLALRNHSDAAKIAFGLTSEYKPMPGDRKFWFTKMQDNDREPTKDAAKKARDRAEKQTGYLQDMLMLWHDLAVSTKWRADDALRWWNDEHAGILPLIKAAPFTPPLLDAEDQKDKKKVASHAVKVKRWKELWDLLQARPLTRRTEQAEDDADRAKRKADREAIRSLLIPVADVLRGNLALCQSLSEKWAGQWTGSDGNCAVVPTVKKDQKGPAKTEVTTPATGWHGRLRLLTDWIMGRSLPSASSKIWSRNVGGLSLTRIASMKSLYQLHKAFAMRSMPDKPRGAPERGESNVGIAQSILNAMGRMREQRVRQLASRVAEAALGVGRIKSEHVDAGVKRPRERVDPPCHAIVVENLTNYRPEETQTRRENRQLMAWSSSKVEKYLSEACQLHGLHRRDVQAGYTSRQDSRTGAPGYRCVDAKIDVENATIDTYWWPKTLSTAEKKVAEGGEDKESAFLVNIAKYLRDLKAAGKALPATVRIPRKSGDLFVAAPTWEHLNKLDNSDLGQLAKKTTQADLNAAANIGLKALLDPDFSGKWWFIPCESATHKPHAEKTKGSAVIPPELSLDTVEASGPEPVDGKSGKKQSRSKAGKKDREIVNLWRDISTSPIGTTPKWRGTAEYWNDVRCRVLALLGRAHTRSQ